MKNIFIVSEDELIAEGLCELFTKHVEFCRTSIISGLNSLPAVLKEHKNSLLVISPDLLNFSDYSLDSENTLRMVKEKYGVCKCFALVHTCDRLSLSILLEAGFDGFIFLDRSLQEALYVLKGVNYQNLCIPSSVADYVISDYKQSNQSLSYREKEVLRYISMGLTSKEISYNLGIAVGTVAVYRRRIMDKLKVTTIAELTRIAIKTGIGDS